MTFEEQFNKQMMKNRGIAKEPREDFLYDPVMRNFPDFAYCDGYLNCIPFKLNYVGRESKTIVAQYNNAIYQGTTTYEGFKGKGNVDLNLQVVMDMMSGEYTATASTTNSAISPNTATVTGAVNGVHSNSVASDFHIIQAICHAIDDFYNKANWI